MNSKERNFVNSLETKIKKYSIPITVKEALSLAGDQFVETKYNDKSTEIVDARIEYELCKRSPYYFISNYGFIHFPGIGVIPYNLYYFQREILKDTNYFKKLVFLKSRQCLTEDNFVMTDRGYISIKDVKVQDKIETLKNGKTLFVDVLDSFYTGKREVCRILTNSGSEINCTLDHKIFTKRGWVEAGNLTLHDEIVSNINTGKFGNFKLESDRHAALIGYYLADGRSNAPSFVNTNIDYINEVLEIGKTFKNCCPYVYKRPMEGKVKLQGYDVRLVSNTKNIHIDRPILNFMKKFGLNVLSSERTLTKELMDLNKKQMSILLNRLYASDGWITYKKAKNKKKYIGYEIGIGAPNYTLIKQIEYILQTKYGIHGYITEVLDKRNINSMRFWKFRVTQKKSVIKFINEIGIKGKTDTEEIKNLIFEERPYKSHQSFEKIRKIEKRKGLKDVYDITTESSDFLTNGLLVHNCGISTLFSLYSFWLGNFHESENIDVVSIKQKKAQAFTKKMFPTMDRLPQFLKTPVIKKNMAEIEWANGSYMLSESASDKAGRGDSLSFLILDELAFYRSNTLTRGIVSAAQPTLTRTGGRQALISCVTEDTYIFTDKGMTQIKDFITEETTPGFNPVPLFKIEGLPGPQICNLFYDSGKSDTIKITTKLGFEVEGTEVHPLLVRMPDRECIWKRLKAIGVKDQVFIKEGVGNFGNNEFFAGKKITKHIAYVLGNIVSKGKITKSGDTVYFPYSRKDWLKLKNFSFYFRANMEKKEGFVYLQSEDMIEMLRISGLFSDSIPKELLQMNETLTLSFLKGFCFGRSFEGIRSKKVEMLKQIQLMMLNIGKITRRTKNTLTVAYDYDLRVKDYIIDEVERIEKFKDKNTYDFYIPKTNTFLSNGIVSHNCVVGDTYIFTENGLQQVSDFIPENCKPGYNTINELKIDGINHQQNTNTFYNSGLTPTKRITFGPNNTNDISEAHPFYIIDETSCFPYWKKTKDIKIGDYALASLREKTFGDKDKLEFLFEDKYCKHNIKNWDNVIDEDMSYFLGLLIGDGSINKKGQQCIITSTDREVQQFLLNNKYFDCKVQKREKDSIHFVLQGKYLINFLEGVGFDSSLNSRDKVIPKRLLQLSRENTSALLRGLFDADGHSRERDGSVGFTSTSKELLKQIKLLFDMFGIQVSDERWNNISYEKSTRVSVNSYVGQITLSPYFSKLFYDKIGFGIERKQENYKKVEHINYSKSQSYPYLKGYIANELFKKNNVWNKEISRIIRLGEEGKITRYKLGKCLDIALSFNLENTEEFKKIKDFYDKDWYLLEVKEITRGDANTYDFVIPETKSFYINGVIGSNTPNGLSGAGSYYAEQVHQLQILGGETETEKLITIDWYEIPDIKGIKPYKGFNDALDNFIKKEYYRRESVRKDMKKFFKPIEEDPKKNPFLKKQYDDLGPILYRQEIEHDFVVSGDQVFPEEVLDEVKSTVRDPLQKHMLGKTRVNGLFIWKYPIPKKRYIIGVDVSSSTGSDFSTIQVLDVEDYEQVAEYKGQVATKTFGKLVKKIARYYNESFVVIECNSIGEAVFNEVYYSEEDPYTNVYKQKKTGKDGQTRMTGWETNVKTRQLMINNLIDYFTVEDLFAVLKTYSDRLYKEMLSFVWSNGKAMHTSGGHDDTLIALGLCLYFRNKANTVGESFLISEDGEVIGTDNINDISEVKLKEDDIDDIAFSEDEEDFDDLFGMSKEQYSWLME